MKKTLLLLISLLPYVANAQPGYITTIMGEQNLTSYTTDDGYPAYSTSCLRVFDVIADKVGNVYLSDIYDNRIRIISPTGIISTFAGSTPYGSVSGSFSGDNGLATLAELDNPGTLTYDSVGNMYFHDMNNQRVRKIDAVTHIITTVAGDTAIWPMPASPADGSVAVSSHFLGHNIYTDPAGNIYFNEDSRIRKISVTTGLISTIAGTSGVATDTGEGILAVNATVTESYIATDVANNIYITSFNGNKIRKIDAATGIIHTIIGTGVAGYSGDNSLAINAQLSNVTGSIRFDKHGHLYLFDYGNNRIRRVDTSTGIITTIAGTGASSLSGYTGDNGPAINAILGGGSMYIDTSDNLYFVQILPIGCIRKITLIDSANSTTHVGNGVLQSSTIKTYPIPTKDILHIEGLKENVKYSILNVIGQIVQQGELQAGANAISTQVLNSGMYMLELTTDKGERSVKRIVKE